MGFKYFTREGLTGLVAAFIALLGLILNTFLPPEWQEIVPLILSVVEGILLILIFIFSRGTAKARGYIK